MYWLLVIKRQKWAISCFQKGPKFERRSKMMQCNTAQAMSFQVLAVVSLCVPVEAVMGE